MGSPPSTAEIQQKQQQHHQNRCREVWASSSTANIQPTNPQITSHEPGSFKLVVSKKDPWDSQSKTANAPGDPSWNLRRTGNPSWNLLRGAKASCAQVARLPSKLQGYQVTISIIAFMRPKIQPPTRCLTGPPTRCFTGSNPISFASQQAVQITNYIVLHQVTAWMKSNIDRSSSMGGVVWTKIRFHQILFLSIIDSDHRCSN